MGCDVHLYIEYRESKNHDWKIDKRMSWPDSSIEDDDGNKIVDYSVGAGRNYTFFGFLAGVRSGESPLVNPRGLPSDLTPELKKINDVWGIDAHTASWLTLKEYKRVVKKWVTYINKFELEAGKEPFIPDDIDVKDLTPDNISFYNIQNYCQHLIDELKVENILLGTRHKPEIRIVFWFDN